MVRASQGPSDGSRLCAKNPPRSPRQNQEGDAVWYNDFYKSQKKPEQKNLVIPKEILERYAELPHPELNRLERWHHVIGDIRGKRILFVGCGVETSPVMLALHGGEVWVLDLAEEAITWQKSLAVANGTEERTHYLVGSCYELPAPDAMFDVVVGIGVLHHLQENMEKACSEFTRVLKRDGFAVFEEPISLWRPLKAVRDLLPIARLRDASPICRPLDKYSMSCISRYFSEETYYYAFLSRFDRYIYGDKASEFAAQWQNTLSFCLHLADYFLIGIPGLKRRLASQMVVRLTPLLHNNVAPTAAERMV
jgi:ubiquinone/menaquinone biosynthesis C-methylase UbiE